MSTIRIAGRDIHIVDDAQAEECDVVVCVPAEVPTPFTDNLFGECFYCGRRVQFRPYAPKKPKRACVQCAMDLARGGQA